MPPKKKTVKKETSKPIPASKESSNSGVIVLATFIITLIVVASLMYSYHSKEMKKVEILNSKSCVEVARLNADLQRDKNNLEEQISTLENEKQEMIDMMSIVQFPKEGWEKYIPEQPEDDTEEITSELVGKSIEEARELLGEPPTLLREGPETQVWVYPTSSEDSTGFYIIFAEGKVIEVILDEFNGIDILPELI